MKEKPIIIPTEDEIGRWVKVKLKERMSYGILPRQRDLLEEYDGAIFEVFEKGKAANTVCTCRKVNGEHVVDCLSHPHPTVHVIDPNDEDKTLEIRSMFLEPVEIKLVEEGKTAISEKTPGPIEEVIMETAAQEYIEKTAEVIKAPVESAAEKNAIVTGDFATNEKRKYVLIEISKDGELSVQDVEDAIETGLLFDAKDGEWISGNYCGKIGQCVPLDGADWVNGFMMVEEGEAADTYRFASSLAAVLRNATKIAINRDIDKIGPH